MQTTIPCWTVSVGLVCASLLLTCAAVQGANDGRPCDSDIFCYGDILDTIQRLRLFNDSKHFVDMPMKVDPDVVRSEFAKLGDATKITLEQARQFLSANFLDSPENALVKYVPADWKSPEDGGLEIHSKITDEKYRQFANAIHKKWEILGRIISPEIVANPNRTSLISVPNPFIIPGGRFREIYYWDSFWVIQGLLVSGMNVTARGMIMNFVHLINQLGHMPNGNRVYYEKRSQPPFLALMVEAYVTHPSVPEADGRSLITEALPALEKEHEFWMTNRLATDFKHNGTAYTLNIFRGGITQPRPESYREDVETAKDFSVSDKAKVYANLGAGAESGWDFSSRWLDTPKANLSTIRAETIIPVDLNAVICAQERIMADFYNKTGNKEQSAKYRELAKARGDAIHAVFWNNAKSMWRDYDMQKKAQREDFYISHVVPLFTRCSGSAEDITSTAFMNRVLNSADLKKVTSYPGGFPQSLIEDVHQQWDFPNAWAPSQLMLIEGFAANPETRATAITWAQTWVRAVYAGFVSKGLFYEKYDVNQVGVYGGGGEYEVQDGFGWTNGGILRLLEMFPNELRAADSGVSSIASSFAVILSCALTALLFK